MEYTDSEIIDRCLKGNGEYYEILVKRYKKRIYNIAYRFTNNNEDALDITQEVFIKAYNSLDKYDPKFKFVSWILKITTNYCLDNKKKKRLDTMDINLDIENSDTAASAENVFLHKENKREITEAINRLPDKYRILIIMYHNQNLSYKEMSEVLNISMTKVKNRLYRARNILKENLESVKKEESKWIAKKLQC
ncbi:sigma-70 family RNA polymerase sigma factor [Clostridium sp. D2Q-11]|uniref:RNA polymerase sigma factor n=1 Tax=Anaeromonas frigoriresistens TaxID=2683708 RepID=A0A942V0A5_9FIRM|nr:sigma-70 family RNA polymerase sigma factor [Anaeromonas frigoriresistens]MBS4539536.1 sigma-70 family RNA polymerase sigma factor [Anaeromonas frigoriresistens]